MKNFPTRLFTLLTGFAFVVSTNAQLVVDTYAPNMYPAANTPFIHGVTSGDPLPNAVIIWTRVDTNNINASISGGWFVATDSSFSNVVASGNYTADS
ncbi:MAG TPA: PhoD-like phosphatase N-terminal domain-containing protein, partial [Chitinophagales bacterium]